MNIFALDQDPFVAASMHCDKHVVKMIVEYAQLLSTAHRVLDGMPVLATDSENRVKPKRFLLLGGESPAVDTSLRDGDHLYNPALVTEDSYVSRWYIRDAVCYNATHANHPSAVWARQTGANYQWLLHLFTGCLMEYTHRYGKTHATARLLPFFTTPPRNLEFGELTPFPQAMPPEYQVPNDSIAAYRAFYVGSKARFARWTNTPVPAFFADAIAKEGRDGSHFVRTTRLD